jgi:S1-C subfamily serine protease
MQSFLTQFCYWPRTDLTVELIPFRGRSDYSEPSKMISRRTNISIVALIAVMACSAPHGAFAQADAKSIYQAAEPSVYIIYVNNSQGDAIALGSGFLIGPRRIITNAHVVRDGSPVIAIGPVRIPAKVERTDELNDLALLSVDVDLTSKPLHLSGDKAETGDPAFVIGNPEGLEKTLSQGIVSGIRKQDGRSLLQITSPISHGSSGGPVLNAKGEVEGVAVATLTEGQTSISPCPPMLSSHFCRQLYPPILPMRSLF